MAQSIGSLVRWYSTASVDLAAWKYIKFCFAIKLTKSNLKKRYFPMQNFFLENSKKLDSTISLFNGISTFKGHLMSKQFLLNINHNW